MRVPTHSRASLLLGGAIALLGRFVSGTSINVALEASFGKPPYLLELLETAAQEVPSSYFPLLDRIAEGQFTDFTTEEDVFQRFVTLLTEDGHVTTQEVLSTFLLSLSLHTAAPRIEAHYQYYNTSIGSVLEKAQDASCPVWVHFNGKQYCSPTLERAQQDYNGPNGDDLPFDRSISNNDELEAATLYVDINNPVFGAFHQVLSEAAKEGKNNYRIRYRPSASGPPEPLRVGGYGVELQLKRTDYIVIDDREAEKTAEGEKPIKDTDLESVADLKPLSASELLGLGLKASSYIMDSENPFETLVRVTQDFPKYSSSLAQRNASDNYLAEHESNRELFLQAGVNVLWMNGLQIPWRQMDAYALLDRLRQERESVHVLQKAGLTAPEAISLISHEAITEAKTSSDVQRYEWRDTLEGGKIITWLNNIEKDSRYEDWPAESTAFLQRLYPGQLPQVRRDLHNLVLPLDMSSREAIETIVETLYVLVQRKIAIRFGFVPTQLTPEATQQARVIYYLRDAYGLGAVINYLQAVGESGKPSVINEKLIEASIGEKEPRKGQKHLKLAQILESEEIGEQLTNAKAYLKRLGAAGPNPAGFMNGVPSAQGEQWMQVMSQRMQIDLQTIQQKVYLENLGDDIWLPGLFLIDAATHRNPLIIPEDEDDVKMIDIGTVLASHAEILGTLPSLGADEESTISQWSQLIVVADLDTFGTDLIHAADSLKKSTSWSGLEVLVVPNSAEAGDAEAAVSRPLASDLGFAPGETGVIVNGRKIGPMDADTIFSSSDLELLLNYEKTRRLNPVVEAIANMTLTSKIQAPRILASISALVALSAIPDEPQGIYDSSGAVRMNSQDQWQSEHTAITVGDKDTATVQIVGSIDPTSELAQRWVPILKAFSELGGVYVKIFLNPRANLKELPIKRFYRYVVDSQPRFDAAGTLLSPGATFEGVPREALLNMGLDVPPAWLVSAKETPYDLDNLKLSAVKTGDVNAIYELEYILIEGHSRDTTTGQAPRGVQLHLGTERNPKAADTLIMANLGYFQFKANPGFWSIRLKPGRSEEVYTIDTIGADSKDPTAPSGTELALMSWQGKTLFPRLSRKPGKEAEDVLEEAKVASTGDFFAKAKSFGQSILSKSGAAAPRKHADINIFSVASGHLYERMLNIMMVSVMKHTSHTVKFWFIEQFLSPSFKRTIPDLAAAYGFEYELVTYKWPHWLRSQKEKQREIWGYKILFLDVLFPLDLDKVIFVDSDQIVRTDMHELVTHDLEGAPYGFTPMCDSRTEMEGFRFWKQGYWKNFLRGLPYHISALYVVDLQRFRQLAAGDRLRGQYHSLSADPNSLSNLDQDLPNNMQMQLPIHSLPQEWLWCETWCSDESLKDARTIDLCNNPLTKEPKLDRARRQVPEWTVYDNEIAEVFRKARGEDEGVVQDGSNIQEELDIEQKRKFDEEEASKKTIKDEL